MSNTSMKFSMPIEIRQAITRLSKKYNYSSESSFLQHLIRREDTIEKERAKLRKFLDQGLRGGISDTPPKQYFADLEKRLKAKITT